MAEKSISEVLIIGGGPKGLFLGSLLLDQGVKVTIVEKRSKNTRTRPVKLLGRILLSEMEVDEVYVFSENQIAERLNAIELMKLELFTKVVSWLELSTPIKTIQDELTEYILKSGGVMRAGESYDFSKNLDLLQNYPDTLVVDCTGYNSIMRNRIQPNNRVDRFVEYVIVWTFIFNDRYECNELCKFYKNKNTKRFQIIPSVQDTYIAGARMTFVTCLITIRQLSTVKPLTFEYLSEHFTELSDDMAIFLDNLSSGDIKRFPIDKMEFVALPLHVYRAKKTTHFVDTDNLNQPWVLMGDSAMGGPYFQSISMGYEAAIYFAYIFKHLGNTLENMLAKYEDYMDKLWLTIQIRSKEIQRNKEILQSICVDDRDAILNKIKIY